MFMGEGWARKHKLEASSWFYVHDIMLLSCMLIDKKRSKDLGISGCSISNKRGRGLMYDLQITYFGLKKKTLKKKSN